MAKIYFPEIVYTSRAEGINNANDLVKEMSILVDKSIAEQTAVLQPVGTKVEKTHQYTVTHRDSYGGEINGAMFELTFETKVSSEVVDIIEEVNVVIKAQNKESETVKALALSFKEKGYNVTFADDDQTLLGVTFDLNDPSNKDGIKVNIDVNVLPKYKSIPKTELIKVKSLDSGQEQVR